MFSNLRFLVIGIGSIGLALVISHWGSAQSVDWFAQGTGVERTSDSVYRLPPPAARVPTATHLDYDAYLASRGQTEATPVQFTTPPDILAMQQAYGEANVAIWQLLPEGMVYKSYLAGTQESRFALQIIDINSEGLHFEGFLGTRVPLLRYGTTDSIRPEGFQVDAEGVAHVRIDLADGSIVDAADFRGGLPLSYGYGRHRTKLGYYHLSSHVQDEFLTENPGFVRLNFSRDVFILGHSFYLTDQLKIYGEVGYAFISDISQPWEFQVGFDYAPYGPTGIHGAPFLAINGHVREEVKFGGALTAQLGWAWVGDTGKMLRAGVHYYNGESNQYSFFDRFEQQIGFGLWYDF
ncbi:MAG TPA: DUF1207 domain-containing protein [Pirellulaceae bacterium]|nr:DUF1207 domain-containing protein [Pirellulaceae bacterium]